MSTVTVMVIVVAVVALAALIFLSMQKQRTKRLRAKFGPEYDRLVHQYGSPQKAEADLAQRERRVEKLSLCDLDPQEAERFAHAWPRSRYTPPWSGMRSAAAPATESSTCRHGGFRRITLQARVSIVLYGEAGVARRQQRLTDQFDAAALTGTGKQDSIKR